MTGGVPESAAFRQALVVNEAESHSFGMPAGWHAVCNDSSARGDPASTIKEFS
jgi:hypothetical protein